MKYLGLALSVLFCLTSPAFTADEPSSSELVRLSWKASNDADLGALDKLYALALSLYSAPAVVQASQLQAFPGRDQVDNYRVMNDVAVVMFIKAEALMHKGQNELAKALFEQVGQKYPWSQSWDPSRGSFWSVKDKSLASIRVIDGKSSAAPVVAKPKVPKTIPRLAFPGKKKVIDYLKYGEFLNVGTKDYHYRIKDQAGLAAAVGEGVYPNLTSIYKDPNYKKAVRDGRLKGASHWDFINTVDLEAALYKWATITNEPWGVRIYYTGLIFEKSKMYYEAIKCYQALIVHFPGTVAMTPWQTPWYPGQAAIAKIRHIIRMNPGLGLELKGAKIQILNSFDNDTANDVISVSPGEIVQRKSGKSQRLGKKDMPLGKPVKTMGYGHVQVVKYENGHWQIVVGGKPFMIKGITYGPAQVGQSPDKGTLVNWTTEDTNQNGVIDAPYEAWLDKNHNNRQDANEPAVGDFALMKKMGVNTLRLYHQSTMKPDKQLLRNMFKEHGFMVILGDFLGKYAIGSGASWSDGTDYENPEHQAKMMSAVKAMVLAYKDEPYILMWLLGNENNYGVASNADKKPDAYYKFVNDVARMIKSVDSNHPVAICNGDALFLDKFAKFSPDVDVYSGNFYRGDYGVGSFWEQVAEAADKPAFISEYGTPVYGEGMSYEEAQEAQALYHKGNWLDIQFNSAGYTEGAGNALGGVAFEWVDEWWKSYEPATHDAVAGMAGPFSGGYYYEEWFGLFGQGNGKASPFLREPRKVYQTYQELWNK